MGRNHPIGQTANFTSSNPDVLSLQAEVLAAWGGGGMRRRRALKYSPGGPLLCDAARKGLCHGKDPSY